jgi:hypothetical protein
VADLPKGPVGVGARRGYPAFAVRPGVGGGGGTGTGLSVQG